MSNDTTTTDKARESRLRRKAWRCSYRLSKLRRSPDVIYAPGYALIDSNTGYISHGGNWSLDEVEGFLGEGEATAA